MYCMGIVIMLIFYASLNTNIIMSKRKRVGEDDAQPPGGESMQGSLSNSSGEKDAARKGLIGINNLVYQLDPDLSVAVNCTDKCHYFQQDQYTNDQRAVCQISSGADYVDPRRSFLNFTATLPADGEGVKWGGHYIQTTEGVASTRQDTAALAQHKHASVQNWHPERVSFGAPRQKNKTVQPPFKGAPTPSTCYSGSGANMIESIVILSRSGDELSRIERLNLLQYTINPWIKDAQWMRTVGAGMGYNRFFTPKGEPCRIMPVGVTTSNFDWGNTDRAAADSVAIGGTGAYKQVYTKRVYDADGSPGNTMRISIPLYCLSGLFDYDRLLPSQLMSGMRIELRWASPTVALRRNWFDSQEIKSAIGTNGNDMNNINNTQQHVNMPKYRRLDLVASQGAAAVDRSSMTKESNQQGNYTGGWRAGFLTNHTPIAQSGVDIFASDDLKAADEKKTGEYEGQVYFDHSVQYSPATQLHTNRKGSLYDSSFWEGGSNAASVVSQGAIPSYLITDINFQLKSIQLTDSVQRILNELSAVNGLEIVYTDYHNTQFSAEGDSQSGNFHMEVRHAASRALRAIMIPRRQLNITNQFSDSFGTNNLQFKSWQWRLGALYFPHQPISAQTALLNNNQTYLYTLDAFGKLAGQHRSGTSYYDWLSEYDLVRQHGRGHFGGNNDDCELDLLTDEYPAQAKYKPDRADNFTSCSPLAVSLERSTLFNLSGIPINNSRVLSFHGVYAGNDDPAKVHAGPAVYDCFLQHVKLARVYMNNVEVEQ